MRFIYTGTVILALLLMVWKIAVYRSVEENKPNFDADNVQPYEDELTSLKPTVKVVTQDSSLEKEVKSVQPSKGHISFSKRNGVKDTSKCLLVEGSPKKASGRGVKDFDSFEALHALDERFRKKQYEDPYSGEEKYANVAQELMLENEDYNNILGKSFKEHKEASKQREVEVKNEPSLSFGRDDIDSVDEEYLIETKALRNQSAGVYQDYKGRINRMMVDRETIEELPKVISTGSEPVSESAIVDIGVFKNSIDERKLPDLNK